VAYYRQTDRRTDITNGLHIAFFAFAGANTKKSNKQNKKIFIIIHHLHFNNELNVTWPNSNLVAQVVRPDDKSEKFIY